MAAAPAQAHVLRRHVPTRVVAALVAVLLVAGGIAFVVRRDGGSAPAPSHGSDVRAVLPELERFVEQARGLRYQEPVKVTLLDDAAFRRRLREQATEDAAEIENEAGVLRAVGLLERGVDLEKESQALVGDAVAGFYDAKTRALVVRGTEVTPYVRRVLVHELTHALDDQWFDLDRPEIDKADSEAQAGFQGLLEGSATRVETAYREAMSPAERRAADREEQAQASSIDTDVPQVLLAFAVFPYAAGSRFVDALYAAGGQPRLDAAFRDPPRSTEELLHPDRYLAGEKPVDVAAPRSPRKPFDNEIVGEFSLLLMLQSRLDADTARAASDGWDGDRYVAWKDGDRTCVRDTVVLATPEDGRELAGALRRWGASVEGEGPVTFTTCDH